MNYKFLVFVLLILIYRQSISQENAINFDGVDDYISLDNVASEMQGETSFTIEFWMKGDLNNQPSSIRTSLFSINPSTSNGNGLLIILGGANAQDGRLLIYDEGSFGANYDYISNMVIGDNVCHHIAYVRNGSTGLIYVDGVNIGSHSSNYQLSSSDLYSIGQEWDNVSTTPSTSQFFNGNIDDFRIWNTARTLNEIQSNMDVPLSGNEPGLVTYFDFNQGVANGNNTSETSVTNSSPIGNLNGTFHNFSLSGSTSNFIEACITNSFTANFSMNDTIICAGESITFHDESPSTTITWDWSFNGGNIASANTQGPHVINFNTAGTYDVVLTASDSNGSNSRTIQVIVNDIPSLNAGNNDTICEGEEYTLIASNPDMATLLWNNGITDNVPFTPTVNSEYIVYGTLDGCENSDTVVIALHPTPELTMPPPSTICAGENIMLNASSLNGATISWNNGIFNNQLFSPLNTSTYTASASLTIGNDVCTTLDSVTVTVNSIPEIEAETSGLSLLTICIDESVTLTAINPSGASIIWTNGVTDNVAFIPTDSLMYHVTATLNGCTNIDSVIIDIVDRPIVQTELDQTICLRDSILLFATTNEPLAVITWDQGMPNNTYVYPSFTQIYTANASIGNCIGTDDITITVLSLPDPGFSFNPNPVTIEDTEIHFVQHDTHDGEIYDWSLGDSTFSDLIAPTHTYPEIIGSTYEVQLIVTDTNGCIDSATTMLTIENLLIYYIPNAFTPDGDELNDTFQPIFTTGFDPEEFLLIIYNRWGEKIFESTDHQKGWDGTYKGKLVQDGIYIWTVQFGELFSDEKLLDKGFVTMIR